MSNIIRHRQRVQLGFAGLVIVSFALLMISVLVRINGLVATCKPSSAMTPNIAGASERQAVQQPQQRTIEKPAFVAAQKTSSEPELREEPKPEAVETSEPIFVAARETETTERTEPEKPEPRTTEVAQAGSTLESAFVADTDPKPEPQMIEEPEPEVMVEAKVQASEETGTEVVAEMEPGEDLEVSGQEVVEEPEPQIVEEPASVVAEEVSPEPEPLGEPNIESTEVSEPDLVVANEPETINSTESEESPIESEPWATESAQYEPAMESTLAVDTALEPESDVIEEPEPEAIEETQTQAADTEEADTETFAEMEYEESLVESELWIAEDIPYESTMESMSAIDTAPEPESDVIEEPEPEAIEETQTQVSDTEQTDTKTFAETEYEESLVEPESSITENDLYGSIMKSMSAADATTEPESDVIEEPEPQIIEETQVQATDTEEADTETFAEMEYEESPVEPEPWITEDNRYELTVESTFVVGTAPDEPEMIEEPEPEAVEETQTWSIEGTDTETLPGMEPDEALVPYELEAVEVTPAESVEVSEPKVAEESQPKAPVMEGETESVSLRLASIIGGKAQPAVAQKPKATTAEATKAQADKKASKPKVVEKPRQQQTVKKKKSIFSFLENIFKSSNDKTK